MSRIFCVIGGNQTDAEDRLRAALNLPAGAALPANQILSSKAQTAFKYIPTNPTEQSCRTTTFDVANKWVVLAEIP